MTNEEQLAQLAYEAYCKNRNWQSYDNAPLPQWQDVRDDIKKGWLAATLAVLQGAASTPPGTVR